MAANPQFRKPGPGEKRCIIRHMLKLYSNLVVAGIYSIPFRLIDEDRSELLTRVDSYVDAMASCVSKHSLLSAKITNTQDYGEVRYVRAEQLNLVNHFRAVQVDDVTDGNKDGEAVRRVVEQFHTDPTWMFDDIQNVPAWSLNVLPLTPDKTNGCHRLLIAFVYSHSHGDGISGLAFHRTLFKALPASLQRGRGVGRETVIASPATDLPEQVDTPARMPISLTYLLLPALCHYLPNFVTRLFGVRGDPVSGANSETWKGGIGQWHSTKSDRFAETHIEVLTLEADLMKNILDVCRGKGAKLTALLNFVIARAMEITLRRSRSETGSLSEKNFVAQVPINLRRGLGISDDVLGNFGGGAFLQHTVSAENQSGEAAGILTIDETAWRVIRHQGTHLAKSASNLRNQPLGLLRYVADFQAWMQENVGKEKSCSWELSNLGSVDVHAPSSIEENSNGDDVSVAESSAIDIQQAFFSQPASPIGPPMTFSVVSVKGGSLNMCISWETGSLGLGQSEQGTTEESHQADRTFVQGLTGTMNEILRNLR